MKKIIFRSLVVFFFIFNSCSEKNDINPEIENIEKPDSKSGIENTGAITFAIAPECNTDPLDWDGMTVDVGSKLMLEILNNFDSQTWTSSNESVMGFTSNSTSKKVTLVANSQGSAQICVTANRNNSQGTCASCGVITVKKNDSDCTPPSLVSISQLTIVNACRGKVFTFSANPNGSRDSGSYQWSSSHGSSIVSGQGTSTVRIQSPLSGGFGVSVTHVNSCKNETVTGFKLAEFNSMCDGDDDGGFGGLGF